MRTAKLIEDAFGPDIDSPAQEWLDKAWDAGTSGTARKHARKALSLDLDCLDAYSILGIHAESDAESIALFREAVRIGERLFAPCFDNPDMHWWGFMGTRPWMRAQHNLGLVLQASGDLADAEAVYARLLELNPNDNQGIRTLLIGMYLENDRLDEAKALLDQYPDDYQIEMVMASLYLDMRKGKPVTVLKARAQEIEERNEFVLEQIADVGSDEEDVEFSGFGIAVGSEAEAFEYAERNRGPWLRKKTILNAILKHVEGG